MSDGPAHFKQQMIQLVSRDLKVSHNLMHFNLNLTNGVVERFGRSLSQDVQGSCVGTADAARRQDLAFQLAQSILKCSCFQKC